MEYLWSDENDNRKGFDNDTLISKEAPTSKVVKI